jgi:hypothetical protein
LRPINKIQILIGGIALFIGSLVYIIDRPADYTYFVHSVPTSISLYKILPNFFGLMGSNLPAFVHVFSFILLTAGVLSCQKRGCFIICLSWFFLDCAFELGQKFKGVPLKIIPAWFSGTPFLENTKIYFVGGTFDVLDLVAIALGTVAAYFFLLSTNKVQGGS